MMAEKKSEAFFPLPFIMDTLVDRKFLSIPLEVRYEKIESVLKAIIRYDEICQNARKEMSETIEQIISEKPES
jgi:predicted nucleic acid-binding OB-fold protein